MSFLKDLPQWFQMLIISTITFGFFFAIWKGYGFRTKLFSFIKNKKTDKKEDNINKEINVHSNCPNVQDVLLKLYKLSDIHEEIRTLSSEHPLKDQMNYAEQKIDQIINLLIKQYLKLLKSKLEDHSDLINSYSYKTYRKVLYEFSNELLNEIRHSFKENHFSSMTESEFIIYRSDKINNLMTKSDEFLNNMYFYKEDITIEELYDENYKLRSNIETIISEMFAKAKLLGLEHNIKISELRKNIVQIGESFVEK